MGSQVRHELREATMVAHQRLHHHPVLAPLAAEGLTLDDYHRALIAFRGLHRAADRDLAVIWPERRPRSPLIAADMAFLGLASPPADAELADLPAIDSRPAALGVRYVIDGSFFGGQALAGSIRRSLGLGAGRGADFFSGGSLDFTLEWRHLVAWLDALREGEARERARDAAVAAFAAVEAWLDRYGGGLSRGGAP